jgi:hypothetical protein
VYYAPPGGTGTIPLRRNDGTPPAENGGRNRKEVMTLFNKKQDGSTRMSVIDRTANVMAALAAIEKELEKFGGRLIGDITLSPIRIPNGYYKIAVSIQLKAGDPASSSAGK